MYNIKTTGDTIYNLPDWQCPSTSSFGEEYEQREYAHNASDSKNWCNDLGKKIRITYKMVL